MKLINCGILAIAVITLTSFRLSAQTSFDLSLPTELKVSGTSTIHDWEMSTQHASGEAIITVNNNKVTDIEKLEIIMSVRTLKSAKAQMDNNAYKALDETKYPHITFKLIEVLEINEKTIKASGNLSIGGKTKLITLTVNYRIFENRIALSGNYAIKFTDFSLEPPTAVFGTIKTGNDLLLSYNVVF